MTPLGKPLVFYLKYMAEMERLYGDLEEDEEPDLMGLDDAEQVRERVRAVGNTAGEKVADFLELCGRKIEDHFTGVGATLNNKRKRYAVLRDWCWWVQVRIPSVCEGGFSCGVWVSDPPEVSISPEKDVCGVVVPYLWIKGGRKAAYSVRKILGGWAHSCGGEGVADDKGTVVLACIPIMAQPPESFDVDREKLIVEVMKIIARIGAEHTKAIASFTAGLKESDES